MWSFMTGSFTKQIVFKIHPYCSIYQYCIPFYDWIILGDMDRPPFVDLFIRSQTFGLFLLFDYYKYCHCKHVCKSFYVHSCVFVFLRYIPWSGIARSYCNCTFNFLRNCQAVFQNGKFYFFYLPFYFSTSNVGGFHLSPHPCQHLLFSVFLIIAILVVWNGVTLWL